MISFGQVEVGTQLPAQSFPVARADLVRYALRRGWLQES